MPKGPDTPGAGAKYDRLADTIGLIPNVRKKDNLFQGLCVLAFVIIGTAAAFFWDGGAIRDFLGDSLPIRLVIGALAGLATGALLSGAILLVLGLMRRS